MTPDQVKILEVMIQYFGETGTLILFILFLAYGVFKYYIAKRQADVINRIEEYLKILSQKYSDTITYEQAELVLRDSYSCSACSIVFEVHSIIDVNNIDKEWKSVVAKIKDIIDIKYAEDFSKLTKFVYNDLALAQLMENSHRDYLHDGIISILEKCHGEEAKRQVLSFVKNGYMRFYNSDISKIERRSHNAKN